MTKLEQRDLAAKAHITIDQVGRLERGENVGLWYVAAIVAALTPLVLPEAALVAALAIDGKDIIGAGVLRERLNRESKVPHPRSRDGGGELGEPLAPAKPRRRNSG